jgi:hypothetical protein
MKERKVKENERRRKETEEKEGELKGLKSQQ